MIRSFGQVLVVTILVVTIIVIALIGIPLFLRDTLTIQALTMGASFLAALSSLFNTFAAKDNAVKIEQLKQELSSQFPALIDSRNAALNYYRMLAKLEIKPFSEQDKELSEEAMAAAEGSIYFLDEKYRKAWYRYWQKARNISYDALQDKENAKNTWKSQWAKELGNELNIIASYQLHSNS